MNSRRHGPRIRSYIFDIPSQTSRNALKHCERGQETRLIFALNFRGIDFPSCKRVLTRHFVLPKWNCEGTQQATHVYLRAGKPRGPSNGKRARLQFQETGSKSHPPPRNCQRVKLTEIGRRSANVKLALPAYSRMDRYAGLTDKPTSW